MTAACGRGPSPNNWHVSAAYGLRIPCCGREEKRPTVEIDLIIFDWGGTLADVSNQPEALLAGSSVVSEVLSGRNDADAARALVFHALGAEKAAAADPRCREVDLAILMADWAKAHGWPADAQRVAAAVQALGEQWVGGALTPLPGALNAARRLREAGYRLGLVSNCWVPKRYCDRELDRQGFAELMDFTVYSSEIGYRKPSKTIYETALNRAYPNGHRPDLARVLFVGDSPTCDVIAPATMGMRTALVAGRPGSWSEQDLARAKPDLQLGSVAELPAWLNAESVAT